MKIRITGVKRQWPFIKDEPYEIEMPVEDGWKWPNSDGVTVTMVEVKGDEK